MKRKRMTALLAATSLAVGLLAGCGSSSSGSSAASSAGDTAASETGSAAESSTESGGAINYVDLSGQDIYVGVAPGSGGSAGVIRCSRILQASSMSTSPQEIS